MSLIVPNLSIAGFRSFRKLDVGPFGRVNLITGKNNSGKSTLLEAIRILTTEGSDTTLFNILNYREETDQRYDLTILPPPVIDITIFCSLFSGFPTLVNCTNPIKISVNSNGNERAISISINWYVDKPSEMPSVVKVQPDRSNETPVFPALEIILPTRQRIINSRYSRWFFIEAEGAASNCIFLDPFSTKTTEQLGALWDKIALTDIEKEAVHAMRMIAPDIQALSMVGSESGPRHSRKAIAKSIQYDHPVPLRILGDGVNRLFGLILSLTNARNGVLLVDEIENGFHYSILPDVWRAVFRIAANLDIQVFATTHSWDCIEAFQKAASEHPEEGVLARLTVKNDRVIPTLFREEDLRIITREKIEVR